MWIVKRFFFWDGRTEIKYLFCFMYFQVADCVDVRLKDEEVAREIEEIENEI